jgi:D-amino-acid oxidase
MSTPSKSHVLVLGGGVTGLQTTLSLLKAGYSVSLVAEYLPGDTNIEYTSPWAGGVWRAHTTLAPEDREVVEWDKATLSEWIRLIGEGENKEEVEKEIGLGIRECLNYWSVTNSETVPDGSGLWWRDTVEDFKLLSKEELECASTMLRMKVGFGVRYKTVFINVPQYLLWLFRQVQDLGANIFKTVVKTDGGVEGVVSDMLRLFNESDKALENPKPNVEAIVLAAGLSSRRFLPTEECEEVHPVRGQTVLVKCEAKVGVTHIFPSKNGELLYAIPRPMSGTTILGGCKQGGNWDSGEDKQLTRRILERAKRLAVLKELLNEDGEFEVMGVQVGRRPARYEGGPRVEMNKETVHGIKVVYAYGHSGSGYQNSVGSAAKVVRLLSEI